MFSEVGNGGVETKIMKISHSYLEIFAILQRMRVVAMGVWGTQQQFLQMLVIPKCIMVGS